MKNTLLILLSILFFSSCKKEVKTPSIDFTTVGGETMGTYYKVTYSDSLKRDFKKDIDSLLVAINLELSTYIDTSTISIFNQTTDSLSLHNHVYNGISEDAQRNKHFITNIEASKQVYEQSQGAFDPTVMPLVNYWGFGYTPKKAVEKVDSLTIDSIMQYIGYNKITFSRGEDCVVKKSLAGVKIDMSACAKGYGVDAVGRLLSQNGLKDYYVEIGGESVGFGNGKSGDGWNVAITIPKENAAILDYKAIIKLKNKAIATSGNYRNFHEVNGSKYAHTINPKTGFPEASRLLSASIFTDECMMADAYATACMVMGLEKAKPFIDSLQGVEGYFIFSTETGELKTEYTEGVKAMILE